MPVCKFISLYYWVNLLVSRDTIDVVKQSAALCLLRLFRTNPECIPPGEYTSRMIHLLNDQHMVSFYIIIIFNTIIFVCFFYIMWYEQIM